MGKVDVKVIVKDIAARGIQLMDRTRVETLYIVVCTLREHSHV